MITIQSNLALFASPLAEKGERRARVNRSLIVRRRSYFDREFPAEGRKKPDADVYGFGEYNVQQASNSRNFSEISWSIRDVFKFPNCEALKVKLLSVRRAHIERRFKAPTA